MTRMTYSITVLGVLLLALALLAYGLFA